VSLACDGVKAPRASLGGFAGLDPVPWPVAPGKEPHCSGQPFETPFDDTIKIAASGRQEAGPMGTAPSALDGSSLKAKCQHAERHRMRPSPGRRIRRTTPNRVRMRTASQVAPIWPPPLRGSPGWLLGRLAGRSVVLLRRFAWKRLDRFGHVLV